MSALSVAAVFAIFALFGLVAFRWLRPAVAALVVFFGGWLLLPVGHYPAGAVGAGLPYWIVGTALPSDMLITKAWAAPGVALAGVALFDRAALRRWRPGRFDLPIVLWCVWPLVQSAFVATPVPGGAVATLYLLGSWGATWLLGRLYFGEAEGRLLLLRGLVGFGIASLPISLLEGVAGPVLYGLVYEPHPFRFADVERYVGYRPIGFLENGNQYGLWICIAALAAVWFAVGARPGGTTRRAQAAALGLAAMAVAAQSAGALVLLACGAGFLGLCGVLRPRALAILLLVGLVGGGTLYLSGRLPVEAMRRTAVGEAVVDGLRSVGRGSFGWRIAQDQRLLADAERQPLTGSGAWDWWRPRQTRPWGLPVLLLGQYGAIGLGLAFAAWLAPVLRVLWQAPRRSGWRPDNAPLLVATLVLIGAADALLNSFIFFPALALAASLAGAAPTGRWRDEIAASGQERRMFEGAT